MGHNVLLRRRSLQNILYFEHLAKAMLTPQMFLTKSLWKFQKTEDTRVILFYPLCSFTRHVYRYLNKSTEQCFIAKRVVKQYITLKGLSLFIFCLRFSAFQLYYKNIFRSILFFSKQTFYELQIKICNLNKFSIKILRCVFNCINFVKNNFS